MTRLPRLIVVALLLILSACGSVPAAQQPSPPPADAHTDDAHSHSNDDHSHAALEEMPHLHGLAFSADGSQLIVPAHTGLRIYQNGTWLTPDTPAHDYMGFAAVDSGFYSSGHPAPGSDLVNPLGLVKSSDGGASLQPLGFAGESDFHLMGVGFRSHAIYVVNPTPNSRMQAGPYFSLDRGETWQPFAGAGIVAPPYAIAVHPDEPGTLAMPTDAGLMQSNDYGATFSLIGPVEPVVAAVYSLDGKRLLFGAQTLSALDLTSGTIEPLNAPQLGPEDVFTYIATHPGEPNTIAVATLERDIFISRDNGTNWEQIADNGTAPAGAQQ